MHFSHEEDGVNHDDLGFNPDPLLIDFAIAIVEVDVSLVFEFSEAPLILEFSEGPIVFSDGIPR